MDDDLAKLEEDLRQLRPVMPSARVKRALAAADEYGARRRRSSAGREAPPAATNRQIWWIAAAVLPIAAAIAVAVALSASRHLPRPASNLSARDVLKPVAAKDVLYAAADEGVVTLDDGVLARKQRLQFVGTITWRDPNTKASLTWTVPREEVRFVPIRYE